MEEVAKPIAKTSSNEISIHCYRKDKGGEYHKMTVYMDTSNVVRFYDGHTSCCTLPGIDEEWMDLV